VARELSMAKSTLHSWLTQADRDGHEEVRADRKTQFIHKAWDAIEKYLEHLMTDSVPYFSGRTVLLGRHG